MAGFALFQVFIVQAVSYRQHHCSADRPTYWSLQHCYLPQCSISAAHAFCDKMGKLARLQTTRQEL